MNRPSFSLYDASAGSGKTYTLVKEYLKIILTAKSNDAYRNILAITFTNKAVHEMKSRIVGNLTAFGQDQPNEKTIELMTVISAETGLDLNAITQKSKQIIKHIIHNYAAFDISTIDKFTHKVIRAFAFDLGLPLSFDVTLDSENLLTEAIDSLIEQTGTDPFLTKLLVDFTLEKADDDKSWDVSRTIFDISKLILNENNREEIEQLKDVSINDFLKIKLETLAAIHKIEQENSAVAKQIISLIEQNNIDFKSFSRGTFINHLNSIVQSDSKEKKHYFDSVDKVAINKTAKDKSIIESILPEIILMLQPVYTAISKKNLYKAFLKNSTPLSLVNTVNTEFSTIQKEKNVMSISVFNTIIFNEIKNQPALFIYERIGERYRHFFIDEFQDTSEMQWSNLIPLIDNATSSEINGEKGTLMIVGDPKQSIYRWRGGKAEQFIELSKSHNPFNNKEKNIVHLDTNYRSYSEVIDFNNLFFKLISAKFDNEDYKDLYQNHSFQKSNNKKGGYVSIEFIDQDEDLSEDDEAEISDEANTKTDYYLASILETIESVLKKGFVYADIAILIRHKRNGTAIANFLIEKGIPIVSSETLLIKNATEVRFISHLLNFLNNPEDLESKAYFLYYLAINNQNQKEVSDFISQGIALKNESEFEQWLNGFGIQLSFRTIRKKGLYQAVETCINALLPAKCTTAYLQYFLDIVLERDVRYNESISEFISFWDKSGDKYRIPSPEGTSAIQIMTIHKSKGLEFPVVIFPFAEENYSLQKKDKLWLDFEQENPNLSKILVDNSKSVEDYGAEAKSVYDLKSQEQLLDNINVLYVALTRAEEQLFVISNKMKPNKEGNYPNNMASFFIHYLIEKGDFDENKTKYSFGNTNKISPPTIVDNETKLIEPVIHILEADNIKIAQQEALLWGTHQQEAREYGNVIHELLSQINQPSDLEIALIKGVESGLINKSQHDIVQATLTQIINHPELKEHFDGANKILNEQTIIEPKGQTIKPDRMAIDNNKNVYLLDYKTGSHQEKYKQQVDNYQQVIESMGYKVIKKALVYISKTVEVVHL